MATKKTTKTSARAKKPAARTKAAAAPVAVEAEATAPRRRGRPVGSKNSVVKGKRISKAAANRAANTAKQPIESLTVDFTFDDIRVTNLENLTRQEAEVKEVLKAIQRAKTAFGKLAFKSLTLDSVSISSPRTRKKKRGPKKGSKRSGMTKKQQIIQYVTEAGQSVKSGEIVRALFEASGEKDKKSFTQSMFTTLSQIYKSGELVKDADGNVSLNNKG
jgi:hypothetical protein